MLLRRKTWWWGWAALRLLSFPIFPCVFILFTFFSFISHDNYDSLVGLSMSRRVTYFICIINDDVEKDIVFRCKKTTKERLIDYIDGCINIYYICYKCIMSSAYIQNKIKYSTTISFIFWSKNWTTLYNYTYTDVQR